MSKPDDQSTKYSKLDSSVSNDPPILSRKKDGLVILWSRYFPGSFSRPNLKIRISVPYCQTSYQTCEKKKGLFGIIIPTHLLLPTLFSLVLTEHSCVKVASKLFVLAQLPNRKVSQIPCGVFRARVFFKSLTYD